VENFQKSSIKVQYRTPKKSLIDVSLPEFHVNLPRDKEKQLHCTRFKTPTFSPPFCALLAQGAKILTREI